MEATTDPPFVFIHFELNSQIIRQTLVYRFATVQNKEEKMRVVIYVFLCELFAECEFCMCVGGATHGYTISPFTPQSLPSSMPLDPVNERSFAS